MKPAVRSGLLWLLLASVLGAAGLVAARYSHWEEISIPLPPHGEALTDPHYRLRHWLAHQGVTLQVPMQLATLPPTSDTLVIVSSLWDVRHARRDELRQWVEAGGHLVLFANTDDELPVLETLGVEQQNEWSLRAARRKAEKRARAAANGAPAQPASPSGDDDDDEDKEDDEDAAPKAAPGLPRLPPPPKCEWTAEDAGATPFFADLPRYRLCHSPGTVYTSRDQPRWGLRDEWGWRALRLPLGRGELTLSGWYERLDSEGWLDHDHPAMMAATLKLQPGRQVWLVGAASAPKLPLWLWQQAAPALLLAGLALALALWRALPRFGPLRRPPPDRRRSLAEQVRGSASFLLRHRDPALHAAQCRALAEAARRLAPSTSAIASLPDAVVLAQATGLSASALAKAMAPAATRPARRLAQDLMLLETARRQLLGLAAGGATQPAHPQDSPQKASP